MLKKAIFWDRDGVLGALVPLRSDGEKNVSPQKAEDFNIIPEAIAAVKGAKEKGYLNIVITNQPDIARGKMSEAELQKMHDLLQKEIPTIDAIYVCLHDDPDNCDCRKPKPGLILEAGKDFGIDYQQSYVVGDSIKDIEAGKQAGCKTIFLTKDSTLIDCNFMINDLKEIDQIIKN